ncbi:MAG: hypothetical protein N4Q32_01370 [Neisseriaceae bacterium]|nr:hypothetical protein [Neisseriaceae bacterium PsAf]MCV2509071.1 hypothetical protein [Neisseriaceae bacterium]
MDINNVKIIKFFKELVVVFILLELLIGILTVLGIWVEKNYTYSDILEKGNQLNLQINCTNKLYAFVKKANCDALERAKLSNE